jgi:hypothetical protein
MMDAIQSLAVLAVGAGTLPIAAGIARWALKALFTLVLEGGDRPVGTGSAH